MHLRKFEHRRVLLEVLSCSKVLFDWVNAQLGNAFPWLQALSIHARNIMQFSHVKVPYCSKMLSLLIYPTPLLPQSFASIFTLQTTIIQNDSSHSNYRGANYSIALGKRGLHWQHSIHSQRYADDVPAISLSSYQESYEADMGVFL